MKKIFFIAAAFVATLGAAAQTTQAKADDLIKVNTEKYDFGKLKVGVPVTCTFEIKNISDKPVVVENTSAGCGCTIPEKIVEPIMPGKTAMLKVQYNAPGVIPSFTKDVYIKLAGIDATKNVQITGEVLSAEAYEEYLKTKHSK